MKEKLLSEGPYSDTEKKLAKRLKKLAIDETGSKVWTHGHCLRLIRKYQLERGARGSEEFLSWIFSVEHNS